MSAHAVADIPVERNAETRSTDSRSAVITVRRSLSRRHLRGRKHERWQTFFSGGAPDEAGFTNLTGLDESRLAPFESIPQGPEHEIEFLTYVIEGALAYTDAAGSSGILRAGEFQVSTSSGVRREVVSTSQIHDAHFIELHLSPTAPSQASTRLFHGPRQRRFYWADRHHRWCLVASADGRLGSLSLSQDTDVYSAVLERGDHLVHPLAVERTAWLQVLYGSATFLVPGMSLSAGDGAAFTDEPAVSFTAGESTEVLLVSSPRWVQRVSGTNGSPA